MEQVIVTRHPAAVAFIARELGGTPVLIDQYNNSREADFGQIAEAIRDYEISSTHVAVQVGEELIPVWTRCHAGNVADKHVYTDDHFPLHITASAAQVTVIGFTVRNPRGQEYSLAEMDAAGAVLRTYTVFPGTGHVATPSGGWTVEDLRAALDRAIQEEEQGKAVSARLMEEDAARSVARERAAVARETWEANRPPNDRH